MTSHDSRYVWANLVEPQDYDQHMESVGQARANAELVRDMLESLDLPDDARILVAGAGTGQMFDFVDPAFLCRRPVTFTDINAKFLGRLEARLRKAGAHNFHTVVDDIEHTHLRGSFDAAILVLVLEHVDWPRAVEQVIGLGVRHLLVVIQQNPPEMKTLVAPGRSPIGSLANFSEGDDGSHLVDRDDLESLLASRRFSLKQHLPRAVPDGKVMHGLVFSLAS